jgi:hypothetical protein
VAALEAELAIVGGTLENLVRALVNEGMDLMESAP